MAEHDEWLAERFEGHRARLRGVASRMLGSTSEADVAHPAPPQERLPGSGETPVGRG